MKTAPVWFALVAFLWYVVVFLVLDYPRLSAGQQTFTLLAPVVGAVVFAFAGAVWRTRQGNRATMAGNTLFRQGRIVEALAEFEKFRTLFPRNALGFHNVGVAQLYLFRFAAAEEHLLKAAQHARGSLIDVRSFAIPALMLTYALRGRTEQLAEWSANASTHKWGEVPEAIVATAVAACREQRWNDARSLLGRREVALSGGMTRALADTLQSYAAARMGQSVTPPDPSILFGEASPDALRAEWPDFTDYILRTR